MKPDWKNVHIELPKEYDTYLIVIHDRWVETAPFFPEFGWLRDGEILNGFVTHWTELPEAPNET
jgi:hypothetical protein